jgi:hypothetical protein
MAWPGAGRFGLEEKYKKIKGARTGKETYFCLSAFGQYYRHDRYDGHCYYGGDTDLNYSILFIF